MRLLLPTCILFTMCLIVGISLSDDAAAEPDQFDLVLEGIRKAELANRISTPPYGDIETKKTLAELRNKILKLREMESLDRPAGDTRGQDAAKTVASGSKGDPLFFNFPDHPMQQRPLELIQYEYWDRPGHPNQDMLFYFDFDCTGPKPADRSIAGSIILFADFDRDQRVGCGESLYVEVSNSYNVLKMFDDDGNNKIDENDIIWDFLMFHDFFVPYSMDDKGMTEIYLDHFIIPDDYVGVGAYTDGNYTKDDAYYEAFSNGFMPVKYSDQHIRAIAGNLCGASSSIYGCVETFSGVIGYW